MKNFWPFGERFKEMIVVLTWNIFPFFLLHFIIPPFNTLSCYRPAELLRCWKSSINVRDFCNHKNGGVPCIARHLYQLCCCCFRCHSWLTFTTIFQYVNRGRGKGASHFWVWKRGFPIRFTGELVKKSGDYVVLREDCSSTVGTFKTPNQRVDVQWCMQDFSQGGYKSSSFWQFLRSLVSLHAIWCHVRYATFLK